MFKTRNIVSKSKYFFIASLAVILVGVILLVFMGMNYGLDFTEGATVTVNYYGTEDNTQFKSDLENKITDLGFTLASSTRTSTSTDGYDVLEFSLKYEYQGKTVTSNEFSELIRSQTDENQGLIADLKEFIDNKNVELYGEILDSVTTVDATRPLIRQSIWAIVVAILAMLIYIAIRFKLISGICAVVLLAHDVMIMITFTTLFQVQVNTTFIAAIITVIGYSINASIVVFDRIKEYDRYRSPKNKNPETFAKYRDWTDEMIANQSIADTVKRTLLTTATTLITIILLSILSSTIREFTLPIIFGLLSGVYSATILASCLWVVAKKIERKVVGKKKSGYDARITAGSKAKVSE